MSVRKAISFMEFILNGKLQDGESIPIASFKVI